MTGVYISAMPNNINMILFKILPIPRVSPFAKAAICSAPATMAATPTGSPRRMVNNSAFSKTSARASARNQPPMPSVTAVARPPGKGQNNNDDPQSAQHHLSKQILHLCLSSAKFVMYLFLMYYVAFFSMKQCVI